MSNVKPQPAFRVKQVIAVPVEVCESKQAKIWAVEWGPDLKWARTDTWFYRLMELDRDGNERNAGGHVIRDFTANEHELHRWATNGSAKPPG